MKVNAIVVTRGDVDLSPIFDSFSDYGFKQGEVLVWNNSIMKDLSVYGRYAAIERSSAEIIYVQDDDVVLPPESIEAILDMWMAANQEVGSAVWGSDQQTSVVCNMPQEFRHDFYKDHALVGFGAAFHRDAPKRAFADFDSHYPPWTNQTSFFHRTCDIVFTGLTHRILVDVPKENLPWAEAPDRMWMQPEHQAERARMLELVKEVRDVARP